MIELRPYQVTTVDRSREAVRRGIRRFIIQIDTGGGKTLVACEMMRLTAEAGNRCLFLAHARELVNQCSAKLDWFGLDHGVIMAGRGYRTDLPIQVGSTATLISRVLRSKTLTPPEAKLIICDEAHRQGRSTRELLKLYPKAVMIGLTATPCRTDGKSLGGPQGYGAIIQAVHRSELIAGGYITPTKVFAPYRPDMRVTKEERAQGVKATGADGDYTPAFRASRMDKRELVGDIVSHWKRYGENRPTIFFGCNIDHSRHAAAAFNEAGVPATHLDADSPDDERRAVLGHDGGLSRGTIKVLCNYGIAVEGVDIPAVGCVVMGRPTKSFIVYKQAVGRACRPYAGPLYRKGYAVLLDHSGCCYEFGLPDTDVTWELDGDKSVEDAVKEKLQQEAPLVTCPECFARFPAKEYCPECGAKMRKPRKKQESAENKDGLLVEIAQDPQAEAAATREKLRRQWQRALAVASARDGPCTMALAIFKAATGLLPWAVPGLPHVPVGQEEWRKKVRELYPGYRRGP